MADPYSHISIQVDFNEASFQWSSFPMDCIGLQSRRVGHGRWPIRTVTFPSRSISMKLHSNGARFQWTSIALDFNPDAFGMADPHSHISIQVDFNEASFQWSSFPMDFHCIGLQSRRIRHGRWPIRTVTFRSRSISMKLHSNGARFQWTALDFNP